MVRISFFLIASVSLPCFGADLVRQPDGLKPGDRYRLFFTTSEGRNALSADIEDYHGFVQTVADAAPVVGGWDLNWRAVVRTPGTLAWINSGTDPNESGVFPLPEADRIPIYRVDGEQIWFDYQHMWNFHNESPFAVPTVTELGTDYENFVWTGTEDANVPGPSPLGEPFPFLGLTSSRAFTWNVSTRGDEADAFPLYAISEVITVIPEPGSISLLLVALMPAILFRRRSRGQ